MARKGTPTFIIDLPLVVSERDEPECLIRLELGRRLHNACLGEALRRLTLMRESVAWQRARTMSKKSQKTERAIEFKRLNHLYGFTSASISAFGTLCKNDAKWNEGRKRTDPRIGAHEAQRIAERAFESVEQYCFGTRGKPRFKGKNRPLHSLEGKSAGSGIKWNQGTAFLEWGGLMLPAMLPPAGKDRWLEEALAARTKFARIVWRNINGKRRWFVQIAKEGQTPLKYQTRDGEELGLDVGPSTVAVYSEHGAAVVKLAPEVDQPWAESRKIQRAMDRSRRTTNPECYNEDGTFKRGTRIAVRSEGYKTLQGELAENERVLQKRRARSHGALSNRVVALGNTIKTEKLSYVSFQKNFGRSTKVRAAGALIALIRRKAERAGGELVELNTWRLKLSQYDHTTNTCTRKSLSQRWHVLGDGTGVVQRDMYSAFLAAIADEDVIHPSRAEEAWPVAQSLLGRAGWMRQQPVSVASLLATASALPAPERAARQRALATGNVEDAVAAKREPRKTRGSGLRTPCL